MKDGKPGALPAQSAGGPSGGETKEKPSSILTPIEIFGVPIHPVTSTALHTQLASIIDEKRKGMVLNVNANAMNIAYEASWFRDLLCRAEVVFCDGAGVILAARLLGHRIPQRITYADWMWQLGAFCQERGYSLFFLGGRKGVAQAAADRLLAQYPRLRIVGVQHGYFDKAGEENERVIADISASKPNILIVAFGMPLQERWLSENFERVEANTFLTGGACFDYVSGQLRRGPTWMVEHGFEWLARLLIEPRRLWRRYLVGNPLFVFRVIKQRLGLERY